MLKLKNCTTALILLTASPLAAQPRAADTDRPRKVASAVRVSNGAIRVDGQLNDRAWQPVVPITDFIQKEPNEGTTPTERMEVRFAYDDRALYIGARMYSRSASAIQAPMGRRDNIQDQTEYFMVSLDTFHDRRTAYAFGVSAAGVRLDRYYGQDDETVFDTGFDPVWEAKTVIDEHGWTAELWIPFSQLRFNSQSEDIWGLNVQRFMPTSDELDYWVPVPRTEKGWASHFGDLRGIQGLQGTRRIEVLPYVAGASTVNANRDRANPFDSGLNLAGRAGADLKMGIGSNLTLEATVNPDFGQVEADPAEVNLSAFETIFPEKRPFFTEGAQLLNLQAVNNMFYSRRIGAAPTTSVSGDFTDYPRTSTIATAAKLTGRLASGTSLGMLAGVTNEESARVSNRASPLIQTFRVSPRAEYAVARVQQEFGSAGSWISLMGTAVHRDFTSDDPLATLFARNALSLGSDSLVRFKRGQYELETYEALTYLDGTTDAIGRAQTSSIRYLQRPDKEYAPLDLTRRSLPGYKLGATFARTGGSHWLWNYSTDFESPGFEPNDIGRVRASDGIRSDVTVRYRETQPGKVLRNYSVGITQANEWNFGGDRQGKSVRANVTAQLANFWTATLATGPNFRTEDQILTRGGPLMQTPRDWATTATLKNRVSAQTGWNGSVTATTNEDGGRLLNINGGVSFRPGPRWQLSVTPTHIRQIDSQQYATTLSGGRPDTYGKRYIFAFIDRRTVSSQFRLNYTFKPDLNLDFYAEPFAASGHYYDFGELAAPRTRERRLYGTSGTAVTLNQDGTRTITDGGATFALKNYDFNVRSYRSNIVLRWEWRPGSTLYLVWQQNRQSTEALGGRVGIGDVFRSLTVPGSNFFVVKTTFWLPVK